MLMVVASSELLTEITFMTAVHLYTRYDEMRVVHEIIFFHELSSVFFVMVHY